MPPVKKLTDQNDLVQTKKFPKNIATFPFEEFNPVQSRVFEIYQEDVNCIIAAATSAGKAQPNSTLVLTPYGFCPIDKIKVGDFVIGQSGKPTRVCGVYPQGEKDIYRVVFNDDVSTLCCGEHLWAVRTRSGKSKNGGYKILQTQDMIDSKPGKWHIPRVKPVEFVNQCSLDIHPYLLGLILGDGGIGYTVILSNVEQSILDRAESLLPEGMLLVKADDRYGSCDYRMCSQDGDQYNELIWNLRMMGLMGKKSHEKFIPFVYKYSSIENRLMLLRGLMDSDGGQSLKSSPTFEVTSKQLTKDTAELIRSLGGWTRLRVKEKTTYKYKGELLNGKPVYRLAVVLRICPFAVSKKRKLWEEQQLSDKRRDKLHSIIKIEKSKKEKCRCISVDAEDGLYVTNDYIVTHNTVCAEMFMADEVRRRGGKAMYLAPLRALAKEKIDDWTSENHHFADLNLSICTGDYRLTTQRKKELASSDLILMTSEMLNARARNYKAEQNEFLKDVGTLVVDESHLLTVPNRGDHLEVGLMKFCQIVPNARIIFLSATMPNVDEIADWVSYYLTQRETYLIESTYRPCPLAIHYETYYHINEYEANEESKTNTVLDIIRRYPTDKFLVFVHTKRTGHMVKKSLIQAGIECEFHNADLEKGQRHQLEKKFKEDPKFRVIIATSTLAWGLNMPARRVIITGIHRGLQIVETYDIWQMAGRAGRPGYDPRGDVYILLPSKDPDTYRRRMSKHQKIESKLLDFIGKEDEPHYKILAFHLVSEIHHGGVKTREDIHEWYSKSLARFQTKELDDQVIDRTLDLLIKSGAVKEEDGEYKTTMIGNISSMFYYSPFDVADLRRNFNAIFKHNYEGNDMIVSAALGNVDSLKFGIVSKAEREEMSAYATRISRMFAKNTPLDPAIKSGYAYLCLMNGYNLGALSGIGRGLQFDFPRCVAVLNAIDSMSCKWGKSDVFRKLQLRMIYGVKSDLVEIVQVPKIGKIRAEKLWAAGLRNVDAIANNPDQVQKVLNMKRETTDKICDDAKTLLLLS